MYFYHEGYHDAYHAAALEDLRSRDRRDDDLTWEPIRIPAILNWLIITSVAVGVIFAAIRVLS